MTLLEIFLIAGVVFFVTFTVLMISVLYQLYKAIIVIREAKNSLSRTAETLITMKYSLQATLLKKALHFLNTKRGDTYDNK